MELPDGLLHDATRRRLAEALAGRPTARHLRLAEAEPGEVGVFTVEVRQVQPARAFQRKRGGTGLVARVTLADDSGEADLVLWDDETRLTQDGPLRPRARLRIQGAAVKAARGGGVELGLGSAVVTDLGEADVPDVRLEGTLLAIGPTRVVGDPPRERFLADVTVETVGGRGHVVAQGPLVRQLRQVLPGARVALEGLRPHPELDGWYLSGAATRLAAGR